MAQIPIGNYGQAVAKEGPVLSAPRGTPGTEAAQGILNTASGIQGQLQEEAKQQQRAKAALTLATVNNALHDAHDEVARGVMDGSVPPDEANQALQERAAKVRETGLAGVPDELRPHIEANMTATAGALSRSLDGVVYKRKQSDTAATIDQFGEQVQREAMRVGPAWAADKYASMVDFTGDAAGWTPEQKAAKKQAFKEQVHYAFLDSAGMGALDKGDVQGLQAVRDRLKGPEGDALDPTKRVTLDHQLFGYQQHLIAQQARAQNASDDEARQRYNAAADVFNKGADLALSGGYFSPDFIKEMTTAAAGTEMAPQVQALIASQARVAGFATRPATERAAILEQMRSARATPGVGTDPVEAKLLQAAETIDGKLREAVKENPWAAAQGAGVIQSVAQINPTNPAEAAQIVAARMKDIGRIEAWAGTKVSPFQPAEVEQIGKMVRSMPVDQAATMLGTFGATIGDGERIAAAAKQMGDKDGTLGLAMAYANAKTTQGRTTAELLLRGEQAIKDKLVKVDGTAETGWRADIAKRIRGAYSNQEVENKAIDAAFLIMAARAGDNTQATQTTEKAVELATGGIVDCNGSKVPLPYGMKESDFDKALKLVTPDAIAPQAPGGVVYAGRSPIPLDAFVKSIPDAQLVHAGQGMYNVRAGAALITNAQGKRITIKVGP